MAEANTYLAVLKEQIEKVLNELFQGTRIQFPVIIKKPISTRASAGKSGTEWRCPAYPDEEESEQKERPEGIRQDRELADLVVKRFPQPKSSLENMPAEKDEASARKRKAAVLGVFRRR